LVALADLYHLAVRPPARAPNFVKAGQAPRLNLSPVNLNAVFTPKLVATGSAYLQQYADRFEDVFRQCAPPPRKGQDGGTGSGFDFCPEWKSRV
jgi:hypothetical protein